MTNKKIRKMAFIAFFLFVAIQIVDGLTYGNINYFTSVIFAINNIFDIGIVLLWSISVRERMIPSSARNYILISSILMIFTMVLVVCRYRVFGEYLQILWYAYYVLFIMLPLMFFLSAKYFGRRENYKLSAKWFLLFIPALLLAAAVLSNDFHHFVFVFDSNGGYSYGRLYYVIFAWCILMTAAGMLTLVRVNKFARHASSAVMPVLVFLIMPLLLAMIVLIPNLFRYFPSVVEIFSFSYIVVWEMCIEKEFIPHNTDYAKIFGNLNFTAAVADENFNTIFYTACAKRDAEIVKQALAEPVLEDGKLLIFAEKSKSGYVYWAEDQSAIIKLNDELNEANSILNEENDLIAAENEVSERNAIIEEKTKIYHDISLSVYDKLLEIQTAAEKCFDEAKAQNNLKYICVLGAYIKRRTNLMLLEYEMEQIDFGELVLSIEESLKYVTLLNIDAKVYSNVRGKIDAKMMIKTYDIFEEIVEKYILEASSILAYLNQNNLRIAIEGAKTECAFEGVLAETEENVRYFTIKIEEIGNENFW